VMDGVEAPEEGVAMEGAVEEILHHIRRDQDDDELHDPRQRSDPGAGSKLKQAAALGIRVIDEADWATIVAAAG